MTFSALLPYGSLLVSLLVGLVGVVVYWRKGGNAADEKAIGAYRNVTDAQEREIKQLREQMSTQAETFRKQLQGQTDSFRAEINALTAKVGELTGVVMEKNDRIKTLEELNTNRNPDLVTLMSDIRNFMQNGNALIASQAAKAPVPPAR